jgi:hypothetical protein
MGGLGSKEWNKVGARDWERFGGRRIVQLNLPYFGRGKVVECQRGDVHGLRVG